MTGDRTGADKPSPERQSRENVSPGYEQFAPEASSSDPQTVQWNNLVQRARSNPRRLGSRDILTLQRTVGNHAVQTMLRTAPAISPSSAPVIQRFITREAMIKLAGPPSRSAQRHESHYVQILDLLDAFEKGGESGGDKSKILTELVRLSKEWIESHKSEKDGPRGKFLQGLQAEAQARIDVKDPTTLKNTIGNISYAPSTSAFDQAERERTADVPDWTNPKLAESPTDKFVFTIAVAVEFDEQLKFAMSRAKSTARNKIRGVLTSTPLFGIRGSKKKGEGDKVIKKGLIKLAAPKNQEQIKAKAARETLENKGEEEINDKKITDMAARSSEVGHTWVKFKKMVGSELKEVHSYGMWPEVGYGHPAHPVPGRIRHPDIEHESAEGEKQLFLDTEVPAKNFTDGMALAIERLKQKPNYTLTEYNCTAFAREISSKVGVAFPKAATIFPAGPTKAFFQHVANPNTLYETMEGQQKGGAKNISDKSTDYRELVKDQTEEREREQREQAEAVERELDALPLYYLKRSSAFWPGEKFGDLEPILFDPSSDNRKVWSTGTTAEYHDPDLDKKVSYTKVKAPLNKRVVVGWIHTDDIEAAD